MMMNEFEKENIFGLGQKNETYAKYFNKDSFLQPLIAEDDNVDINVANVTFEPGCRNDWHIHHDGYQLLLVTAGQGWYQEFGKPARRLKAGDVVKINEGVKHWHGATKDSWFAHVAITKGTSEWLDAVSDEEYAKLSEEK